MHRSLYNFNVAKIVLNILLLNILISHDLKALYKYLVFAECRKYVTKLHDTYIERAEVSNVLREYIKQYNTVTANTAILIMVLHEARRGHIWKYAVWETSMLGSQKTLNPAINHN